MSRHAGRRPILAREIVFMVLIVSYVLWNVHARMKNNVDAFHPSSTSLPVYATFFSIFRFQRTRSPKGFLNCSQRRENITGSFNTYTGIFNKVSSISNRFTSFKIDDDSTFFIDIVTLFETRIALMLQIGILFTWNFQSKLNVNWKQTLSRDGIKRSRSLRLRKKGKHRGNDGELIPWHCDYVRDMCDIRDSKDSRSSRHRFEGY